MKNYKSNLALVEAYVNSASTDGKSNNMSFRGSTIYSYGSHFPVATRGEGITFFNMDGYSNTTRKHKSLVLSAIAKDNIIECMYVPTNYEIERNWLESVHLNNLNYWEGRIERLIKEIENPRTRNKSQRLAEIQRINNDRDEYKNYFNL